MNKDYTKPEVIDYGDLTELTASGGGDVTDVPQGTPTNGDPNNVIGTSP